MIRRWIVAGFLVAAAGVGLLAFSRARSGEATTDFPVLPSPPRQSRPAWWREQGVVVAGSWEALSYRIRASGDYDGKAADLKREQSEEMARRLKDFGFNLIMIPLYKGFGLQNPAERETMESAKRFTEICHRLGLKVGCYTFSGTIGYESFLAETPEAEEWLLRDHEGNFTYYDVKYYRRWANRSHPGLRRHMRELVRYAIDEANVDLIHFDNYMFGPAYEAFSVGQFREFLKRRYSPEQRIQRFGFAAVDFIEPPPPPPQPDRYNADPLYQDWLEYRCETQATTFRELADYGRTLNPSILMETNPHGYRGELNNGTIDHARLLPWGGAFWDEGYPSRLENGRLISRFRSHKLGRYFDNMVFQYTSSRVSMAESMANNLQSLGCPAWFQGGVVKPMVPPRPAETLGKDLLAYIRFFRGNQHYFRDAAEISDVAVLNSFANTAYGPQVTRHRLAAFEQALYQGKVPFTIVPDRYPGDLRRFRVIVLADLALISDELLRAVRAFVQQGGGLVMTGDAALYDEVHRRRPQRGLIDLFQQPLGERSLRVNVGQGRAVYLPRVEMASPFELGDLPRNRQELLDAVRWAAAQPFQVAVEAPETVTMSFYAQPSGRRLLHLVNYDEERAVSGVAVTLQIAPGRKVESATLLSPDTGESRSLPVQRHGSEIRLLLPKIETYGLVVID